MKTPKRVPASFKMDPEFLARLRAASQWTPYSQARILEEGGRLIIRRLENKHNDGQPFPQSLTGQQ